MVWSGVMNTPGASRVAVLLLCALPALAGCQSTTGSVRVGGTLGTPAEVRAHLLAEALTGVEFVAGRVRPTAATRPLVDPLAALTAVDGHLTAGRRYEAIASAVAAVRGLPGDVRGYAALARALLGRGRLVEAEAALRTGLDLEPANPALGHELAGVLEGQRRWDEAVSEWRQVLAGAPDFGPAHSRLAVLLALLGESEAAASHARTATALGFPPPPQWANLGQRAPLVDGPLPGALPRRRIDAGGTTQAVETTVTGDPSGQFLIAGWNDLRAASAEGDSRVALATSTDGGITWVDRVIRSPGAVGPNFEFDPMVAYDPRTGNQWIGGILFGDFNVMQPSEVYVARRQPGTNSFFPAVVAHQERFVDKGLLAVGPRPGLPDTTRLYVAFDKGVKFSDDLGATWSPLVTLGGTGTNLGHVPRVGPNGILSIVDWNFQIHRYHRSTNGGVSFEAPRTAATRLAGWPDLGSSRTAGTFRQPPIPGYAVDPNSGVLYIVYADTTGITGAEENVDVYLANSSDGGLTWSIPIVIHGDSTPPRDQFTPWIEVGADGRLHVVFFDTRRIPQLDADPNGFVDLYYATSTDGGATWSEKRVNVEPLESQFAEWQSLTEQFLGDYLGLHVMGNRVRLVYPVTTGGDLDIVTQVLDFDHIFQDGFESGTTAAWSGVSP
jgi:Flp pilus assembly protein TadD